MKKNFSRFGPYEVWYRETPPSAYKDRIVRNHYRHPSATLSQLNGHPGKGQRSLSNLSTKPTSKIPFRSMTVTEREIRSRSNKVLQLMRRKNYSLTKACERVGISPEAVINNTDALKKESDRWVVKRYDTLERSMVIYSNGRSYAITVKDSRHASLIGRYHNAVKMYRDTKDVSYLKPFKGKRVRDIDGQWHTLETDPRTIYEIQERTPDEEFIEIYNSEV